MQTSEQSDIAHLKVTETPDSYSIQHLFTAYCELVVVKNIK